GRRSAAGAGTTDGRRRRPRRQGAGEWLESKRCVVSDVGSAAGRRRGAVAWRLPLSKRGVPAANEGIPPSSFLIGAGRDRQSQDQGKMNMTEAEWLRCIDVRAMVACRPWGKGQRKARLFACACCRRLGDIVQDRWCRQAIEIMERFVDGSAAESDWEAAERELLRAIDETIDQYPYPDYMIQPEHAARGTVRWL